MPQPEFLPIQWKSTYLSLLDQRALPGKKEFLEIKSVEETIIAIREMAVRGAPAIAITGIFGLTLGAQKKSGKVNSQEIESLIKQVFESRPTAVNLSFALQEAKKRVEGESLWESVQTIWESYALEMMVEDLNANQTLGTNGANLFPKNQEEFHIITHCNTGALATAGHGTALGVIRSLRDMGKKVVVYADETRPFLQGSRLTAFEMMEEGIECYIITDGMSGWLMNHRKIDAVLVGCDRVAANGDTANKIGTYNLAIVAHEHNVPFYVCATKDSFDLNLKTGEEIPIEMRKESEVTQFDFLKTPEGKYLFPEGKTSPVGARALNPSFDITKAKFIKNFITELGCFVPGEIPVRLKKV
ncbi:S-methyl-5-thioribose-1-phosphate isomerase [Leptospira levettii]|uniref:Methylthioribose-1-phosphate isomerase n=1 Tax=Leptospira levettii TaxID=2023178 RepID=A0A5F2D7D1_9LEPT|nr:S-methyl-5-thioribose-1-phosphate isomerase [Leptospira levettii]MCG6146747.1 S-methyl-5-thioribose-1-phosphate isomerase [Leptospira levettii]MCW7465957.1 S-methyl-5-thioribose-1-phosphate isomerase [Leptospira levettii]MCW7474800.1 S-methyl-5-thioribose-1-phosphate isomerase [Leptospira levettii]MCW7510695.1 S-methyl-5-thioribose-1-phosphate isomerase [Leptospira levettii]MCW7514448.1 S-methyl-5-thioribose-1-phosphate isomerase [Leptospira levettii]